MLLLWPALFIFLPVFFVALVWAVVTACRILFPEEETAHVPDEAVVRAVERQHGHPVRVGAREIRADIRLWQREHTAPYSYEGHVSHGLPEAWWDDVAHRMN